MECGSLLPLSGASLLARSAADRVTQSGSTLPSPWLRPMARCAPTPPNRPSPCPDHASTQARDDPWHGQITSTPAWDDPWDGQITSTPARDGPWDSEITSTHTRDGPWDGQITSTHARDGPWDGKITSTMTWNTPISTRNTRKFTKNASTGIVEEQIASVDA